MNVKFKRLHPDAKIPQYATEMAAGFDLVAVEDVIIAPGETAKVPLGFAVQIPPGYEIQIRPRSGVTFKTKLRVANSPGTVDGDYRGEVAVLIDNIAQPLMTAWYSEADGYVVTSESKGYLLTLESDLERVYYEGPDETTVPLEMGWWRPDKTYLIRKGDRIAQGVLAAVSLASFEEVAELDDTERGDGGFGSTGTHVHNVNITPLNRSVNAI
ncbi:deoxyuridine 5'-triphosphate nucleotidohydrolase [Paenibacillus sp. FSL R5-0519]|uniref:dUTP diphosphatase n=2 Tax=Paenibacillus sp. FSL R5-0519 TaxID=2921648 RepID=UPI0030D8858A